MNSSICTDLPGYLSADGNGSPPPHLIAHIEGCPDCRARLFAYFQELGIPPADDIDCAACLEQLDGFVEAELLDPESARQWYPTVWGHLWTCSACLEDYELLRGMIADPAIEAIAPPHRVTVPVSAARRLFAAWDLLEIQRATLQAILPALPIAPRRSLYGADQETVEILEGSLDGGIEYSIEATRQSEQVWQVSVRLDPMPPGTLVLRIDDFVVRASATGANTRAALIPDGYLNNPRRGHLAITLEPPQ